MTSDREFVSQVEQYYCKQQKSKLHSLALGCALLALTVFGHDWLSTISEELPMIIAMWAGVSFSIFFFNYWGSPADKLLGEAVEKLTK